MQLRIRKLLGTAIILLALLGFGVSCERGDKLILQREWTANAEYAGDIWAAQIASGHGIRLEVREGSEVIDPIKMVRSGTAHFGVASADRILRENEGGADLIVIAVATYQSPVVFLTRADLKITEPREFVTRTIGLQPGTNTELIFYALARAAKLPLQEMKIVDSGWGTQLFETGTIDVLGAFEYDEPITLALKHHPLGKTIVPETYGVRYVGTVYFTRKALIVERPQVVQDFVNALVEGWRKTLERPGEAMDLLAKRFESVRNNMEKERRSLDAGLPYFSGEQGQLLYASRTRWTEMADSLRELGKLKAFDFNANVDYRFLDKATAK